MRVSATDWLESGWTLENTVNLATELAKLEVDLLDCSSGGIISGVNIPVKLGYQVSLAAEVKQKTSLKTGAVGLITQPEQAEEILQKGYADLIFLGRPLLSDPYWTYRADQMLKAKSQVYPVQYQRALS